jgi:hypothetical protein
MGYFDEDEQEATRLERIWNSTLGIPQQLLWRIARSIKKPSVIASRKGLLAPELIPGFSMFFSHKTDVRPEELFGKNIGAQIAGSILTDPLSYFSMGLTGIGSAGLNMTKAVRLAKAGEVVKGVKTVKGVREAVKSHVIKTMEMGGTTMKQRRALRKAEKLVSKMGNKFDDMEVGELTKRAGEAHAKITLPMGILKSQISLRGSRVFKGLGETQTWGNYFIGGYARRVDSMLARASAGNIPVLRPIYNQLGRLIPMTHAIGGLYKGTVSAGVDHLRGFAHGFRDGAVDRLALRSGSVENLREQVLGRIRNGRLHKLVTDKLDKGEPESILMGRLENYRDYQKGAKNEALFTLMEDPKEFKRAVYAMWKDADHDNLGQFLAEKIFGLTVKGNKWAERMVKDRAFAEKVYRDILVKIGASTGKGFNIDNLADLGRLYHENKTVDELLMSMKLAERPMAPSLEKATRENLNRVAYDLGETMRRWIGKKIHGITGIKSLDALERESRVLRVSYTRRLEAHLGVVGAAYKEIAQNTGTTPEQVSEFFSLMVQMIPGEGDINRVRKLTEAILGMGPTQRREQAIQQLLGKHLPDFTHGRVADTTLLLREFGEEGGLFRTVADDALSNLGFGTAAEQVVPKLKGVGPKRLEALQARFGKHLKGLEDMGLEELRSIRAKDGSLPFKNASQEYLKNLNEARHKALIDGVKQGSTYDKVLQAKGKLDAWAKAVAEGADYTVPADELIELADALDEMRETLLLRGLNVGTKEGVDSPMLRLLYDDWANLQAQHDELASAYSVAGMSRPIAFLPRIRSTADSKRILTILGEFEEDGVIRPLIQDLRASHQRNFDHMTHQSLNRLVEKLRRVEAEDGGTGARELLKRLDEFLLRPDEKYATDAYASLVGSLSTMENINSVAGFMRKVSAQSWAKLVDPEAKAEAYLVGEVIASGRGANVNFRSPVFKDAIRELDDDLTAVASATDNQMPTRWVTLRDPDSGRVITVPLESEDGFQVRLIETGTNADEAISRRFHSGPRGHEYVKGESATPDLIDQLLVRADNQAEKLFVEVGSQSMLTGVQNSMTVQFDHAGAVTRHWYDTAHMMAKIMTTTVRPDFHINNLISSSLMLKMNGLSLRSQTRGFAHTMALLGGADETADTYGKVLLMMGKRGGKRGFFRRTRNLLNLPRRVASYGKQPLSDASARVDPTVFVTGSGQEFKIQDIFQAMADYGLLNTHAAKGVAATNTEGMAFLEEIGLALDQAGVTEKLVGKVKHAVESVGSASEMIARLTGFFGYLDEGYTLEQAARKTTHALFDYADLTPWEQQWAKRLTTFYTFPRKMIPMANEWIAKTPQQFVALYHAQQGLRKGVGDVQIESDYGTANLHVGNKRFNLARAAPQFETLQMFALFGDLMPESGEISHQPDVSGKNPFPIGLIPGTVSRGLVGLTSPDSRPRAGDGGLDAVADEVWAMGGLTRWATRTHFDGEEETPFEWMVRQTIGAASNTKEKQTQWLKSRFMKAKQAIRARLRDDPEMDPDDRAELIEELKSLQQATAKLIAVRRS